MIFLPVRVFVQIVRVVLMTERFVWNVGTFHERWKTKRILIWFWLFLIIRRENKRNQLVYPNRYKISTIISIKDEEEKKNNKNNERKGSCCWSLERELSSLTTRTLNVSWRTSKYVILSSSFSLHDKCLSPISIIFHLLPLRLVFLARECLRERKTRGRRKPTLDCSYCFCRRFSLPTCRSVDNDISSWDCQRRLLM